MSTAASGSKVKKKSDGWDYHFCSTSATSYGAWKRSNYLGG